MGNPFIPLPRIENALIIGDKAAECLQLNFCIRRRSIWNALLAFVISPLKCCCRLIRRMYAGICLVLELND